MARGTRILANRHIPAALFCRLVAIFERSRPWECRLEEEGQDRSISSPQGAGGVRYYVEMWPTYASSSNFSKTDNNSEVHVCINRLKYTASTSHRGDLIFRRPCQNITVANNNSLFNESIDQCRYNEMFRMDLDEHERRFGS